MNLEIFRKDDEYIDYYINDHKTVGTLLTVEDKNCIFIRHIGIFDNFKRKGYAYNAVCCILRKGKEVRLCITSHSCSAALFWTEVFQRLKKEKFVISHIKGNTWSIKQNDKYKKED